MPPRKKTVEESTDVVETNNATETEEVTPTDVVVEQVSEEPKETFDQEATNVVESFGEECVTIVEADIERFLVEEVDKVKTDFNKFLMM